MSSPSCRNPDATSKVNRLGNSWVLTCLLIPQDMKELAAALQHGEQAAAILILGQAR